MKNLCSLRRQLQHLIIGDLRQLAGVRHDTGIGGVDAVYVGVDLAQLRMYFVGTNLPYWQVQVTNALKNNDYNTWYTAQTKDYTATQHSFGIQYVD